MLRRLILVLTFLATGWPGAVAAPTAPERIVSLTPSITETLFALGVGDKVVGVTRFCNYPPEARERPKVGGLTDVDVEAVLALHPGLVIAEEQQRAIPKLRELGLQVLAVRVRSLEDLPQAFRTIGKRVGREARAQALIDCIQERFDRVAEALMDRPGPKVLLIVGRSPVVAAGKGTFLDALLAAAGGENVVGDSDRPYPVVSMETVLLGRPEVIIECSGSMVGKDLSAEAREAWSRWPTLPAVQSGRVYVSKSDAMLRPGPRVTEALDELLALLHPEVARALEKKPSAP